MLGDVLGEVLGDVLGEVIGEVLGDVLGEVLEDVLGDTLGKVLVSIGFDGDGWMALVMATKLDLMTTGGKPMGGLVGGLVRTNRNPNRKPVEPSRMIRVSHRPFKILTYSWRCFKIPFDIFFQLD